VRSRMIRRSRMVEATTIPRHHGEGAARLRTRLVPDTPRRGTRSTGGRNPWHGSAPSTARTPAPSTPPTPAPRRHGPQHLDALERSAASRHSQRTRDGAHNHHAECPENVRTNVRTTSGKCPDTGRPT
jgi:hypothetical protein